jgi:hypothetical protein
MLRGHILLTAASFSSQADAGTIPLLPPVIQPRFKRLSILRSTTPSKRQTLAVREVQSAT